MLENFITKLREYIILKTSFSTCYTPDLPQDGNNVCCVTLLTGTPINSLKSNLYNLITFRVLVRGSSNDTTTRALTDEVWNELHLLKDISFTDGKIINIYGNNTPVYVGRDINNRILYNMTFNANVK